MYELSKSDRVKVERELKDFAFEQSPLFKQNLVQGMSIQHEFSIVDDWDRELPEELSPDHNHYEVQNRDTTTIEIGFSADRSTDTDSHRPIYTFAARLMQYTVIRPRELIMPEDAWKELSLVYGEDTDEDDPQVDRNQIINELVDSMEFCERYRRVDFSYDTRDRLIQMNDESGYLIGDTAFNVIETHPLESDTILDDDSIDSLSDNKDIIENIKFEDTVSELRDEYDENGNIMPHKDKFNELQYLMNCLKKRMIVIKN